MTTSLRTQSIEGLDFDEANGEGLVRVVSKAGRVKVYEMKWQQAIYIDHETGWWDIDFLKFLIRKHLEQRSSLV